MKTIILLFALSSCSTPYQKSGFSGGYSETQMASDIYQVSFKGNGYTKSDMANRYLQRRCAEIAIENGYSHYIVMSDRSTASHGVVYFNDKPSIVSRPENMATIKLLKSPSPENNAFDARMVLNSTSDE